MHRCLWFGYVIFYTLGEEGNTAPNPVNQQIVAGEPVVSLLLQSMRNQAELHTDWLVQEKFILEFLTVRVSTVKKLELFGGFRIMHGVVFLRSGVSFWRSQLCSRSSEFWSECRSVFLWVFRKVRFKTGNLQVSFSHTVYTQWVILLQPVNHAVSNETCGITDTCRFILFYHSYFSLKYSKIQYYMYIKICK